MNIIAEGYSEIGQRRVNQDRWWVAQSSGSGVTAEQIAAKGLLCLVADGMGGHADGDVAADSAVKAVSDGYYGDAADTAQDNAQRLRMAIDAAHQAVLHQQSLKPETGGQPSMGTTLVGALFKDDEVMLAHVGDSRCYLLRQGALTRLTSDHTTPMPAGETRRGGLTRALGQAAHGPDVSTLKLSEGDRLLLCTDGVWASLDEQRLVACVSTTDVSQAARQVVTAARDAQSLDNITAVVIGVQGEGQTIVPIAIPAATAGMAQPARKWLWPVIAGALLLVGLVFGLMQLARIRVAAAPVANVAIATVSGMAQAQPTITPPSVLVAEMQATRTPLPATVVPTPELSAPIVTFTPTLQLSAAQTLELLETRICTRAAFDDESCQMDMPTFARGTTREVYVIWEEPLSTGTGIQVIWQRNSGRRITDSCVISTRVTRPCQNIDLTLTSARLRVRDVAGGPTGRYSYTILINGKVVAQGNFVVK